MPTQEIYDAYEAEMKQLKKDIETLPKKAQAKKDIDPLKKRYVELNEKYKNLNFPLDEREKYYANKEGEVLTNYDRFLMGSEEKGGGAKDQNRKTFLSAVADRKQQERRRATEGGTGAGAQEASAVIPKGTVEGEVDEKEKRLREMEESKQRLMATRDETRRANMETITETIEDDTSGEDADDEDTETESIDVSDIISEASTGAGDKEEEKEEEKTHTMPDGTTMTGSTHSANSKPVATQTSNVSMSVKPVDLPRSKEEKEMKEKKKADFIPRERLAVEGKTADELRDDIKYFLKEFKGQLKQEAEVFKRVKTLDDMQRLHRRIIGKLQPDEEPKEEKRRMVEVDMERYIDERVQRLIMENMMNSVKPQAVMIDVEGQAQKKTKDVGSYELKANKGGKMFAKREPIYRAIPSTNPDDIEEQFDPYGSPAKVLKGAPTKKRTLATTAKRQFMQSPFRRPMQTIDLKYIA